ncbi:MAG: hypothetical protein WBN12_10600 [Lutimonas sp.]|jgi:hypothetical protein
MNKYVFVIFIAILFSCQQEKMQSSEDIEETLKAVVVGETFAYMEKDYQKWASFWDHSGDVLRLDVSQAGFSQTRGWDKSGGNLESFFKENPEPITSTFVNSNYLIFYDVNLAWVAFDQTWTSQSGEETVAKATITLVKKANDWKIISYTAIQYEAEDENVDTLGRE